MVNALLRTCPTSPWRFEDLNVFVTLGLEEGGPRCRNSAVELATTLYRRLAAEAFRVQVLQFRLVEAFSRGPRAK